jgi:ABC-2 type transport system ATP-binding protein
VELAQGAEGEQLLRALMAADVGLSRFEIIEPSLQSIFIAKVGADAAHPVARGEVA